MPEAPHTRLTETATISHLTAPQTPVSLDALLTDAQLFSEFVYTPWDRALAALEERRHDAKLGAYVASLIPHGVPDALATEPAMVLFQHFATPNFETHRFFMAADSLPLRPLVFEYHKDKFTNRNEWKFAVAKPHFLKGINKHGEPIVECRTIIDVNASNMKPFSEVTTHWGERLIDFHHTWFNAHIPNRNGAPHDLSDWLQAAGEGARGYYKKFLALFLQNGILFETYLRNEEEYGFTQSIILPALAELRAESGYAPLIVRLQPELREGDRYWTSYPHSYIEDVDSRLNRCA